MQWSKTIIQTLNGQESAIEPLVISASRTTDIPAFHARWFINRLRSGYCAWENSFNPGSKQYISFKKCQVFVFWSKYPQPIMSWLSEIEERGYQYYFQYTLNDYEREGLEPRIPQLIKRIVTFKKLSERIGRHRIIWRYDPIIVSKSLSVANILERIQYIAEEISPFTEKFVFSFLDLYKKTKINLKKIDPSLRPPTDEEIYQLAKGIVDINNRLPYPLVLATCAEKIDLSLFGISHNRCIDPDLLIRLCPKSQEIMDTYSSTVYSLQNNIISNFKKSEKDNLKDIGQRILCGCAHSKDIGHYNTCMHLCTYCYANQSKNHVINRMNSINKNDEHL